MTDNPDKYPARPVKSRKRPYRERPQESGYRQTAVWLDSDAYALLRRLMEHQAAGPLDAAEVISTAIKHYYGTVGHKRIVPRDASAVPRDVPRDTLTVPGNASTKGGRYMPPALEDRILALRESGLSLNATARQLADERYFNAKGAPYGAATLSKAESRAKTRSARHSAETAL